MTLGRLRLVARLRRSRLVALAVITAAAVRCAAPSANALPPLPDRLTDQAYWRLVVEFSEPNGYFNSDNLVSNEDTFQTVVPELTRVVPSGGVYLGVGPDQNFSYIAAIDPKMAFITDIRRGNLLVQLMYKALIELSSDRADFLSRLFSRPRPAGIAPAATVEQLFEAFDRAAPKQALFDENAKAIVSRLKVDHQFALDADDVSGLMFAYSSFFQGGPSLRFVSNGGGRFESYPSFEDLHLSGDGRGVHWSYLASENRFRILKRLEDNNLIVPLVGNFAGPRALKAVGGYLKERGAVVTVFYLSNVERYLFQDGIWGTLMQNVAALPLGDSSTFIRSCFDSCSQYGEPRSISMLDSMSGLLRDTNAGRVLSYRDVLAHSHR
jgi:hypothetical protein